MSRFIIVNAKFIRKVMKHQYMMAEPLSTYFKASPIAGEGALANWAYPRLQIFF
jgi:hypothetical protein